MSPPGDATAFLVAGYGLTWVALMVYWWRVERRLDEARRAVDGRNDEGRDPVSGVGEGSTSTGERPGPRGEGV